MKDGKFRKSAYNIGVSMASQAILMITGFILPKVILSLLGSEINGFVSSLNQVYSYLELLRAGMGMAAIQALYKPLSTADNYEISAIVSTSRAYFRRMGIVYLCCVTIIAIGFAYFSDISASRFDVFFCVFFQGLSGCLTFVYIGYFTDLLRAEGRNYIILIVQTGGKIVAQVLSIIVLVSTANIAAMRAVNVIITLTEILLFRQYRRKHYAAIDIKRPASYERLKNRSSYLLFHVTGLICTGTDTVVISAFGGFKMASVYAVYYLIASAVNAIINTVYSSTSFLLGHAYQEGGKQFEKAHDAFFTVYVTMTAALFSVCSILMKPFIELYTVNVTDIEYVYRFLPSLFCLVQILTSCKNVGDTTINVGGFARNVVSHAILEASINLVLSVVLVNMIGIYGALIGTVVALTYRMIDVLQFSNKMVLKRKCFKNSKVLILNLALFTLASLAGEYLHIVANSYFAFFSISMLVTPLVLITFFGANAMVNKGEIMNIWGIFRGRLLKKLSK